MFDGGSDVLGFGPWIPTESERSLMVRVRQELKHELEQVICAQLINYYKTKTKYLKSIWFYMNDLLTNVEALFVCLV